MFTSKDRFSDLSVVTCDHVYKQRWSVTHTLDSRTYLYVKTHCNFRPSFFINSSTAYIEIREPAMIITPFLDLILRLRRRVSP